MASRNNGKSTRFMTFLRYGAAIQGPGKTGAERNDALANAPLVEANSDRIHEAEGATEG
jgi:hypothetical protein